MLCGNVIQIDYILQARATFRKTFRGTTVVASVSNPVNRIRKKVHFEDFDANANANADGIKTGTAWAAADDGMLVWDRNGNGSIDSGRELFGDETILANGQKAANGFAALAELDTGSLVNGIIVGAGDGKFDAKDAQYANLRVWRDLNQDGISQAGELQTLAQRRVQGGFIRAFAPISLDSAIKPTASSIAIKSKATCARRLTGC